MSTKPDPVFAVYAKYAPVRDLNFYLVYATRHNAEFSARTPAIVREMIALSSALSARLNGEKSTAPASTTAQKRLVWTLIDRFKASIAGWYGTAGVERWEPLESTDPLSREYRAPVVETTDTIETTEAA